MAGNRHKRTVGIASIPNVIRTDGRQWEGCCESFLTLASLTQSDRYYNDVNLLFLKKSSPVDTVTWKLIKGTQEIPLTESEIFVGVSVTFTGDQNVSAFQVEWRAILAEYGNGCYKAVADYNINGTEGVFEFREFNLQPWSLENTEGTVRMLSIFDDYSRRFDIDFTNTGCVDTIRFKGFFGKMQPNATINNHTSVGFEKRKVQIEYDKSYELIAEQVTVCYSDRLIDEHLLHANEIMVSDHNASNHDQRYRDFPLILRKESAIEPEYFPGSRYANITATLDDKVASYASGFNGINSQNTRVILEALGNAVTLGGICTPALVLNSNGTYEQTVNSGGTLTLPDTTVNVYVNGVLNQTLTIVTLDDVTININ